MDFRLLGPLEVAEHDRVLALGSGRQRALLAVLLLHANELVSADRLIDSMWGPAPPATARKIVQVYVSRLRKELGDGRLITQAPGYVLRVEPSELDVARFEQLVGEATAEPDTAVVKLGEALALWRGPPLADLAYEPFAQSEILRLDELHWAVLEQRIDGDLAAGRHHELVGELDALIAEHPLRERLRSQLMLALYRSGRQAEALEVYRQARAELSEELGLEPGEELKRLEQAILRQDPGLDLPVARRLPPAAGNGAVLDGAEAPAGPATEPTRTPWMLRHRRAILAGGMLALTAAIAGAILTLATGGETASALAPVGNGLAAIGPSGAGIGSFVETATAPSNIAVGEGAVWFLNTENRTVSRLDPRTHAVTGRFTPRGVPTDIAAGAGALWIGTGGGASGNYTLRISRVDPRTARVTRTVKLPDRTGNADLASFNWGHPAIAVGAGAVWALNPDQTISRIDPATGKLVAKIDVDAGSLAVGKEGVWVGGDQAVRRIDPRTNRIAQTVPVAADTSVIAVGGGDVWVAAGHDGVVWRIELGAHPVARAIALGAGVDYVAYGAGAAWVGNYIDGTVSRIDPRTNAVTRIPVGAVQALAAGAGGAWVSTAGRPRAGTLPASACEDVVSGGRKPDVLVASDLSLQGPSADGPRAMADAIRLVLKQRDYRAGRFTVGFRSCDDSTAQTGGFEQRRCAANATAYAGATRLVGVIGPYSSYCAQIEIPILNRAPGGPLAMISPTNTDSGLTRGGFSTPDDYRGQPEVYYPTGIRNYVRLAPGDDVQGTAYAVLAKRLGLDGVYLLSERESFWKGLLADPFQRAAGKLGVRIAGASAFDPQTKSFRALADTIARSGAKGVLVGGDPFNGGDRLLKALRARLGPGITIMAGFYFNPADTLHRVGRAARGIYVSTGDLPRIAFQQTAAGRRFSRDVGRTATQDPGVLEAGQAAELVMDAIARSDGTRASVLDKLRASHVKDGILGSFGFDPDGDITTAAIPILRITGSTRPGAELPDPFGGAVVDRVIEVPASLVK